MDKWLARDIALNNLRPDAQWVSRGDEVEWLDTEQTQPTEAELNAEITKVQNDYTAKQYQRDRKLAYPKIEEQLDMLWHSIDSGTLDKTSDFYITLKQVKDTNPKPTE